MKVKRKKGTNAKAFVSGKIYYKFQGKGPWEIEDKHFRYLSNYFEPVKEVKDGNASAKSGP